MDWKSLITDLRSAGMSQAAIGAAIGKSQAWVCAVLAGQYADLKWSDGEALRRLHTEKLGADETVPQPEKEAA
jgi:hypothetical protein